MPEIPVAASVSKIQLFSGRDFYISFTYFFKKQFAGKQYHHIFASRF